MGQNYKYVVAFDPPIHRSRDLAKFVALVFGAVLELL